LIPIKPPASLSLHNRTTLSGSLRMSATEIARRHFSASLADARTEGVDDDAVCRALLGLVVSHYVATRPVADVQAELRFVADNCDPDTDFAFMRP
jgi:hypothetical protein